MHPSRRLTCFALLAATLLVPGCAYHAPFLEIPLTWLTTDAPEISSAALTAFEGKTVSVVLASHEHGSGVTKVGENHEYVPSRPVRTHDDVRKYVVQHVAQVLRENKIRVVPSSATRVLKINVKDFFVDEQDVYRGRVLLDVELEDGAGNPLWTGVAKGTSKRWGRSFSQENYEETFSGGTLEAVVDLLNNPDFQKAVRGG